MLCDDEAAWIRQAGEKRGLIIKMKFIYHKPQRNREIRRKFMLKKIILAISCFRMRHFGAAFLILCAVSAWVPLGYLEAMGAATFYIVRHGQTDWNREKRIQGHSDVPLNEAGKAEAAELAHALNDISFSACFSSDLQRAYETARILILDQPVQMPITVDERLRERNCGCWEGFYYSDFYAAGPAAVQDLESSTALQQRIFQFLQQCAEERSGDSILVVTHGGVLRNLILQILALEVSEERITTKNTAVLKLEYAHGQWSVKEMREIQISISG